MCGIVGAVAQRDVTDILIDGLKRLEYRGYDSAGIAVLTAANGVARQRTLGKVSELCTALSKSPIQGSIGIAHTRWATHGKPEERNAHPHSSGDGLTLVHNGIIENHQSLRTELQQKGFVFESDTDTEVIAHLIADSLSNGVDFIDAIQASARVLNGAFALGVLNKAHPDFLVAIRKGSPLVIGVGYGENFIASDHHALLPYVKKFIYLEEGDLAVIRYNKITIYDAAGIEVQRDVIETDQQADAVDKGEYRHFMLKEIFEQPSVFEAALAGRLSKNAVLEHAFGVNAAEIFDKVESVQVVACGTSYHAGLVMRYWLESLAGIACNVEVASEYRYRQKVVSPNTLFITISQSGETADTMAALKQAKTLNYLASLSICNVPNSALARYSDLVLMTRAGSEIGVASTKAFTTQLTCLLLLTAILGRRHALTPTTEAELVTALQALPTLAEQLLTLDAPIKALAKQLADKNNALFIARGVMYPIVLEGALKLKEISYIHAEAYPAGELKHGPLALVDEEMPVIALAPSGELFEKMKSNIHEVAAREGSIIIFTDKPEAFAEHENVITMKSVEPALMPILYTIPMQLLAYYVAVRKGTDVDQPRNLAKSVTVE